MTQFSVSPMKIFEFLPSIWLIILNVGEMLVGLAKALLIDEISTGLDSSTNCQSHCLFIEICLNDFVKQGGSATQRGSSYCYRTIVTEG